MALDPLEQFRLTMGHVVSHPELGPAIEAAWSGVDHDSAAAADVDIDVLPTLLDHGFALPEGATARLTTTPPPTGSGDNDVVAEISVCIFIAGTVHCVTFQPPIVIQ
jgi:hypothetical protein